MSLSRVAGEAAALVRARHRSSDDRFRHARKTLVSAASLVGALAAPDPLGILAYRGYAFAP